MIMKCAEDSPLEDRIRRHRLALALVAVSQGVAFFHAGDPILRSKSLDRDSYNSGTIQGAQECPARRHVGMWGWALANPVCDMMGCKCHDNGMLHEATHEAAACPSTPVHGKTQAEDYPAPYLAAGPHQHLAC